MANRLKSSYYFQQNPEFSRLLASNAGKIGGKTMTDKKRAVLKKNRMLAQTLDVKED